MSGYRPYQETTSRFGVLKLDVHVHDGGVGLRLRPAQRSFDRVDAGNIEEVHVTEYSPATYAGWHWGLRTSPGGNKVYRVRGSQGVEVRLTDGRRVFVGSENPMELERAIAEIAGRD